MTIKQFLKPTKGKVIITVLAIFIIYQIGSYLEFNVYNLRVPYQMLDLVNSIDPIYYFDAGMEYLSPHCACPAICTFNLTTNQTSCGGSCYCPADPFEATEEFIVVILILVFWYIISCLIVWFYDKFRKKK